MKVLRHITNDRAEELMTQSGKDMLAAYDTIVPYEYGTLQGSALVYTHESVDPDVVTVIASYGKNKARKYAIPEELGAPEGNPPFWGHLQDLSYTTEGTDKAYMKTAFTDYGAEATLKLLATNLLSKVP
jgi:hypothetical protein